MTRRAVPCVALVIFLAGRVGLSAQAPSAVGDASARAALLQKALDAQRSGRTTEAMDLFRAAAERHQSVRAYLELARMKVGGGDAVGAMETLSKARAVAPNSEEVLSAFARLALATKTPLPAVQTLDALTRLYPAVAQYHYLLGVGLMALGDTTTALESLTEADRLEPDRGLTLLALGLALNNRKRYSEAKIALMRGLDLQPDNLETIAALAESEAGLGEFDRAAAHAERTIAATPGNATAHLVMGMVLIERQKYEDARDALLKAAQADPESFKIPYQLSLVYARLGDDTSARRYLELYEQKLRAVEDQLKAFRGGASADTRNRR